jgi:hypothetical protein
MRAGTYTHRPVTALGHVRTDGSYSQVRKIWLALTLPVTQFPPEPNQQEPNFSENYERAVVGGTGAATEIAALRWLQETRDRMAAPAAAADAALAEFRRQHPDCVP